MKPDLILNCSYASNCNIGKNPNETELFFRKGKTLIAISIPLEQAEHLLEDLSSEIEGQKEYVGILNVQ